MKIKMLACLFLHTWLATSAMSEDNKVDVLGVWAGMPTTELLQLKKAKNWRCGPSSEGPSWLGCETERGRMNIFTADELSGAPVASLRLFFNSADKPSDVIASISKQFGKQPVPLRSNDGYTYGYQWGLSNSSTLRVALPQSMRFTSDPALTGDHTYTLDLDSDTLVLANRKAAGAKASASSPTPKF